MLFIALSLGALASEPDLQAAFHDAAEEFDVPEKILLAIAYEASHWQPGLASTWGGYGLFDMREDDGGPNLEAASLLLDASPDTLIRDPVQNVRGAAALLARHARRGVDGKLPPQDDLLAWWDAVRAFSGRHEPNLQVMYASYIYELINFGAEGNGLTLRPEPVNHWDKAMLAPPPTSCDYAGCATFTDACTDNYSEEYSRTASDIDYIVIHTVQGSYAGCISWFQNCSASVSAHYVVRSSDGQVTQTVPEADVAWHAGNWSYNLASVGIEHEGYVEYPEDYYTDAMYAGSAALSADIASRQGISIDRSHIIGHNEVPGATHTDPGSGWDWDYYMSLISGGEVTGDLIGVVADSDIYTGARLVGATVWIAETGETATTDSDGYYRFYDLALDTYTVHATMSGYDEGTCAKDLASGTNWCSIALYPASGGDDGGGDSGSGGGDDGGSSGGDDGGSSGGGTDTSATTDTGPVDDPGPGPGGSSIDEPGELVSKNELGGGCGCATGSARVTGLAGLLGIALAASRRKRTQAPTRP